MSERAFPLDEVLTITTGRLVATRHMDAIYDVLNFMTGDDLFTHQLPRAAKWATPLILEQHPALASVLPPTDLTVEGDEQATWALIRAWLAPLYDQLGSALTLISREDVWAHKDMITELVEMRSENNA